MGTKNNPAKYDCYANALPDEPMFIVLGRDRMAAATVRHWAQLRLSRLPNHGFDHPEEMAQIADAIEVAKEMEVYADERQQEKNRERIAGEKTAMKETT